MVEIRRRDFLKFAGAGAAAAMVPGLGTSLFAQSQRRGAPVLVVIYQRGGMDAINALIPYKDRDYRNIRPTIGVPSTDGDEGAGVLKLDSTFGLHPSMLALMPYWKAKQFAPIINVGSPHRTRSHRPGRRALAHRHGDHSPRWPARIPGALRGEPVVAPHGRELLGRDQRRSSRIRGRAPLECRGPGLWGWGDRGP